MTESIIDLLVQIKTHKTIPCKICGKEISTDLGEMLRHMTAHPQQLRTVLTEEFAIMTNKQERQTI
jgi:hypothetical protein